MVENNNESGDIAPVQLQIDARNLACPMPLLKAKQALSHLTVGEVVQVEATDAASVKDFHAFVELTSHEIVHFKEEFGTYTYHIKKGQSS